MQTFTIKRGDTISLAGTVTLPAPTAGVWHMLSQVRDASGNKIADLVGVVTAPVAPSTAYTVTLAAGSDVTKLWPLDTLFCDARFYDEATPPFTRTFPTFQINVDKEQSNAG